MSGTPLFLLEGPAAPGHPRPMLRRDSWWTLDGEWDFALEEPGWEHPDDVKWTMTIEVPFAPETEASGVCHRSYIYACWYRREVTAPEGHRDRERIILHFGAVDHDASVWI